MVNNEDNFSNCFLLSIQGKHFSRLGSSIEEHPAHIIVPILSLEKQARGIYCYFAESYFLWFLLSVSKPDNIRGWLQLETFPEDERICPVKTLKYYLAKVISRFIVYLWSSFKRSTLDNSSENCCWTFACLLREAPCRGHCQDHGGLCDEAVGRC